MIALCLSALAVAGITNLFASGSLFTPAKEWLKKRADATSARGAWWFLASLASCQHCISFWAGVWVLRDGPAMYFAAVFLANVALVTFQLIGAVKDRAFEQAVQLGIQRQQFAAQQRRVA